MPETQVPVVYACCNSVILLWDTSAIAWQHVLSWSARVISTHTIRSVKARGLRPPIIIPLQCYARHPRHFTPTVLLQLLSIARWLCSLGSGGSYQNPGNVGCLASAVHTKLWLARAVHSHTIAMVFGNWNTSMDSVWPSWWSPYPTPNPHINNAAVADSTPLAEIWTGRHLCLYDLRHLKINITIEHFQYLKLII